MASFQEEHHTCESPDASDDDTYKVVYHFGHSNMEVMGDNPAPEVVLHAAPEALYAPSVQSDHKPILEKESTKKKRTLRFCWSGWSRRRWWTIAGVMAFLLLLGIGLVVGLVLMKHKPNSGTTSNPNGGSNTSNISNTYNISNNSNSNSNNSNSNNSNTSNTSNNSNTNADDTKNTDKSNNSNSSPGPSSESSNPNPGPDSITTTNKSPAEGPSGGDQTATHSGTGPRKCRQRFRREYLPPDPEIWI
ncbi:hypothetical protein QBC38DRAFT_460387 [Podospora fimiseda]|uniref:Uncharacterized protein n=1 Tax=Podospora fimiseda TaxID=252190 RepID=A0AAN7BE56_9PEZI|nr:hypothetical protein QBC38DRAFT_460387 [Podospora fimiseda]